MGLIPKADLEVAESTFPTNSLEQQFHAADRRHVRSFKQSFSSFSYHRVRHRIYLIRLKDLVYMLKSRGIGKSGPPHLGGMQICANDLERCRLRSWLGGSNSWVSIRSPRTSMNLR